MTDPTLPAPLTMNPSSPAVAGQARRWGRPTARAWTSAPRVDRGITNPATGVKAGDLIMFSNAIGKRAADGDTSVASPTVSFAPNDVFS